MVSISSWLILCRPSPWSDDPPVGFPVPLPAEPPAEIPALLTGTPFTIIKGELFPPKEDWPRIRILDEPPGPPAGADIFNPATFPTRLLPTLVVRFVVMFVLFTVAVA